MLEELVIGISELAPRGERSTPSMTRFRSFESVATVGVVCEIDSGVVDADDVVERLTVPATRLARRSPCLLSTLAVRLAGPI